MTALLDQLSYSVIAVGIGLALGGAVVLLVMAFGRNGDSTPTDP